MDLRVRGVLIFECNVCNTFFSVSFQPKVSCPGCKSESIKKLGDGFTSYNELRSSQITTPLENLKEVLRASDISEMLAISKTAAYSLMKEKDFPLIDLGKTKRVKRTAFLKWIENKGLTNKEIELNLVDGKHTQEKELFTAEDIAEILGKSKRVAYEIMDRSDFPLIKIRRSKRVLRNEFFRWLSEIKDIT